MSISLAPWTSRTPASAANAARAKQEHALEHQLQSVFSAVLEQAGRQGYASAEPLTPTDPLAASDSSATPAPLETKLQASWQAWFDDVSSTRYQFVADEGSPSVRPNKTAEDLRTDYSQLLAQAYREGGYVAPKSFLATLSKDQLSVLQQVQHLADPIRVSGLSEEGALNLLLPPDTHVDLNNDGLTSVGVAQTLRFPDSQTPTAVRDAWEIATLDMDDTYKSIYQLMLSRNLHPTDNTGQPTANLTSVESYLQRASDWLEHVELFKSRMPIEQYLRDTQFWTNFREQIQIAANQSPFAPRK